MGAIIKRAILLAALIVVLLVPLPAAAHLLPAQNATLHMIGQRAYLVVSVPIAALQGIDDNQDGLLSIEELDRHKAYIGRQFEQHFQVSAPEGRASPGFFWVFNPQTEYKRPPPTNYIVILAGVEFPAKPTFVTVRTDLFGRTLGEGQMIMRASRDNDIEIGVLNRTSPQHEFFRGPLATTVNFIRVGFEHILLGPDHLLFLLTVMVVGANWRYWVMVITSFTVAHSITLTLAVLGVVQISPSLVEPAIAASIVLVAADNLFRRMRIGRERIVLVMACGLLHGLGFASALGAIELDPGSRIASLIGFNLGVELGQIAFVIVVLAISVGLRRAPRFRHETLWPSAVSLTAGLSGFIMFINRFHMLLATWK